MRRRPLCRERRQEASPPLYNLGRRLTTAADAEGTIGHVHVVDGCCRRRRCHTAMGPLAHVHEKTNSVMSNSLFNHKGKEKHQISVIVAAFSLADVCMSSLSVTCRHVQGRVSRRRSSRKGRSPRRCIAMTPRVRRRRGRRRD